MNLMNLAQVPARWRWLMVGGLGVVFFLLDFLLPGGFAGGIPYVVLVGLVLLFPEKSPLALPIGVATVCSLLVLIVGFRLPASELFARFCALLALWGTAIVGPKVVLSFGQLASQVQGLQDGLKQTQSDLGKERVQSASLTRSLSEASTRLDKMTVEHKQTQFLLDGSRQPLILITAQGAIDTWNPEAETTFQFAPQLRGCSLADTLGLEVLRTWLAERPSERRQQDVSLGTQDGPRDFSLCLSPTADADGRYVVALTEIRGDQLRIQQLSDEKEQLKAQFISEANQLKVQLNQAQEQVSQVQKQYMDMRNIALGWQTKAKELDSQLQLRVQEIQGLHAQLKDAAEDLDHRKALKQRVLEELEYVPNAAVVVRENAVCWMNGHARELFGYGPTDDFSSIQIEDLLPGLNEKVRQELVAPASQKNRLAPDLYSTSLRRRDGLKWQVLVDAMPSELLALDNPLPDQADLLLILRDATPLERREEMREFICPTWWETPVEPAPIETNSLREALADIDLGSPVPVTEAIVDASELPFQPSPDQSPLERDAPLDGGFSQGQW